MCFRVWLAFSRTHDTRLLFFLNCPTCLIAIRLLSHHLQLATGLFVISLCRFFTLRTFLLSFETTQNHPDFIPSNALQKFFPTLYIFTSAQSFHHLPSLPDSRSHGFTLHYPFFAGDVAPHFVTDTYEFCSTVFLSHR